MYDVFFKKYNTTIDTRLNFNENELYITGALGNQLFSLGAFDIENKSDRPLQFDNSAHSLISSIVISTNGNVIEEIKK